MYRYLRASERKEIPFIRLHFTDHMNVNWKSCWKSKSREKKKKKNIKCWCCCYYYYCYQKWKKQCRISVFLLCGRLYVMYLCITCGLHFARCLSHEMKQFLVTKGFVSESCCCQDAISWTLSHLFSITNPFTHKAAITKLEVVSTLLISLLGSELNVSIK